MNDIEEQLRIAWKNAKRPDRTIIAVVMAAVLGVAAGWGLHAFRWRADDFDYVVNRAIYTAAHCKKIEQSEQVRRIEARIGSPMNLFNLEDKIAAMDYAMDRISLSRCGPQNTPK